MRSTKRSSDSRPALTWSSMSGTSVCTPVMPEWRLRIRLAPSPPAYAARGRSRGCRRCPGAMPRQMPSLMRGVAHRRVHLRQSAEPLVAIRAPPASDDAASPRRWRRPCDPARKSISCAVGDVQHMHALAGLAREPHQPLRAHAARLRRRARPDANADRPRRANACARAAGIRPRNGTRRGGGSTLRIARTPSSSSTSSEPVDEPMNTLTPAAARQPLELAQARSMFSRVPPTRRRSRNACGGARA